MSVFSIPATIFAAALLLVLTNAANTNRIYSPCSDTTIQISDGFTFGIAFAATADFNSTAGTALSPCDSRLNLAQKNSRLSVFRPKVDEISLLTVNTSSFAPQDFGGHMVAFAGRKYAARSPSAFVANGTHTVTSFTLVLEFKKGRLRSLYWKRDGCSKCKGTTGFVCLNNQDCAIKTSSCKRTTNGAGTVDCSLGIQLAFSGTDKHLKPLNSWYEVEKLRQYSLYGLYSNLKDSLSSQYSKIF